MRNIPETVHEYNIPRLNVIFVLTSILLLGSVVWMVWYDYDREWKPYQYQAQKFEQLKLILDIHEAESKADEANIDELIGKKFEAEQKLKAEKEALFKLEQAAAQAKTDLDVATAEFQAIKAKVGEVVSKFDAIKELDAHDKRLPTMLEAVRKEQGRQQELQLALDEAERTNNEAQAEADREKQIVVGLDKEIGNLEKDRHLAQRRLDVLTHPWLDLLNNPLVEFAAPTIRVKQTITEEQTYDINFTHVPRIDRCISCHSFAEKKDGLSPGEEGFRFSDLPEPWRSHPRLDLFVASDSPHALQKFGCSTCHFGSDRGVGFVSAAHTPQFYPDRKGFVFDKQLNRWLEPASFERLGQNYRTSRDTLDGWRQMLEEKRANLSKEVAGKPGNAPERIELARVREDLEKLNQVIASVPAAQPLESARKIETTQEHLWHDKYGWHPMHHKEDTMRPGEFIESSCWKCHQQVTYIPEVADPEDPALPAPGEKINAGIGLVQQAGCYACHPIQQLETKVKYKLTGNESLMAVANKFSVEPEAVLAYNGLASAADLKSGREIDVPVRVPTDRAAPSLKKIRTKVTPEWTEKWLLNPKSFRVNTFMPQFWGLDNNRPGMKYTSQNGKEQFDWGDRNIAEIRAITAYLFELSEGSDYAAAPAGDVESGKKLVADLGCFGCHVENQTWEQLPPKDRRFRTQGPMLNAGGSKYNSGWLYAWLKDPAQYHARTRMPNLRLSNSEAADITAYLLSTRDEKFDAETLPVTNRAVLEDMTVDYLIGSMPLQEAEQKAQAMAEEEMYQFSGEKLVRRYGCYSCHSIEGLEKEKPVSIDLSDWASKKIPQLDFGFVHMPKNHYAWLHQKVSNPRSFDRPAGKRPQEYLKMPQYNFNEDQIELIMTAIMSLTNEKPLLSTVAELDDTEWQIENGRWLIKELNCAGCHAVEGRGGGIYSTIEAPFMRPPSLAGVGTKVRPDWLYHFFRNPGEHKFRYWLNARMPTFSLTDMQLNTLLRYFALLDKKPYPFEASTMTDYHTSPEMVAAGTKLFTDFKCLQCHEVTTPEKARERGNPAPDLALVKTRMRPNGVVTWLQDPPAVTPGVAMPANWPLEGPSPFAEILDGDSLRQIEAVRDYLMEYRGQ